MASSSEVFELSLKVPRIENHCNEQTPFSVTELKDEIPISAPPCIVRMKRLGNMIRMMVQTSSSYEDLYNLSVESSQTGNRGRAIRWIKEVSIAFNISSDARDSGIQIFDKFSTLTLAENNVSQMEINAVSYAAAVSILLGTKLHDSKRELTMSNFECLKMDELIHFERLLLFKTGFSMAPQITPTSFVRKLLIVWQEPMIHSKLADLADSLVAKFWEEPKSLLFTPCTVAIAALILSFSISHMDCTEWLNSIPNFCFPSIDNGSSLNPKLFDIDECLIAFKKIDMVYFNMEKKQTSSCKKRSRHPPEVENVVVEI
mmetsp:Transcript_10096/g.9795  ORF Transcript_10096/g.9795 Transcript_10096/m.9795 type:complete len:316 (-) Transcript_10096:238-1185(-)